MNEQLCDHYPKCGGTAAVICIYRENGETWFLCSDCHERYDRLQDPRQIEQIMQQTRLIHALGEA